MAEGFVHTVHFEGFWANTIEGETDVLPGSYATKGEAIAAGRGVAKRRKTEHVIHNEDGSIAQRSSYGDDPSDRPG